MWDHSAPVGDPSDGECRQEDEAGDDEPLKQSPGGRSDVVGPTPSGRSSALSQDDSSLYDSSLYAPIHLPIAPDPHAAGPMIDGPTPYLEPFLGSTVRPFPLADLAAISQHAVPMEPRRFSYPGAEYLPRRHPHWVAVPWDGGSGAATRYPLEASHLLDAPLPHPPPRPMVPAIALAPYAVPGGGYVAFHGASHATAPTTQGFTSPDRWGYVVHHRPSVAFSTAGYGPYHPPIGTGGWNPVPAAPNVLPPQMDWAVAVPPRVTADVPEDEAVAAVPGDDGGDIEDEMDDGDCKPPARRPIIGEAANEAVARGEDGADDDAAVEVTPAPVRPTRPLSAYNLFFRDERLKLLERQRQSLVGTVAGQSKTTKGTKKAPRVGFTAMAQEIARRWKDIDETTLEEYQRLADLEMEAYKVRKAHYRIWQQAQLEEARARMDSEVEDHTRLKYLQRFDEARNKTSKRKKKTRKQPRGRDGPPPGPKPPPPSAV